MKKGLIFSLLIALLLVSACSTTEVAKGDGSLQKVLDSGKLTVAMDVPYGVMEYFDEQGNIVGIDADLAKAISAELGVKVELIDYEWDNIFVDVKSGAIDVALTSMTITDERSQEMLFSIPYFNAGQTIIVRADDDSITAPEDLSGKKIGAQIETTSLEEAKKYTSEDLVVSYESLDEVEGSVGVITSLENGEIDAIIADYIAAADIIKNNKGLKIAIDPFTQEFYGIPTKLGNEDLMNAINDILREFNRNGKINEIKAKYIN